VFDCSRDAELWIRHALKSCVPINVWKSIGERLAFVCMDSSDGRRLTREFCENHEIILLSERIIPRGYRAEDDPKVRYFWFAVLHEVAHAYRDHVSPAAISAEENAAQEGDADELAYAWFNKYLKSKKQPEFTSAELEKAKAASQEAWDKAFGGH
jgi:hypothetical protein